MSSIEHVGLIYCFQHSQDPRVRLVIGNLVCGLFDVDLWISDEHICNESSRISTSEDPKKLTDFISKTVLANKTVETLDVRKKSKLSMARAFVLKEADKLKLSKSEAL